uniref:Retrotransposon protein, putative, unclassified n=1 Tax=Oryza sativa subsp. japonica TaxID=39947 RepID=Q2QWX1_ORYSJ|nr:retrotransposon protein, putative, unclassified [Oryza sativa Japonica Group]
MSKEEVNAKKEQSPKSMVETFQATVDEAIHRALFDQSEVLADTLQNLIKRTIDELIVQKRQLGDRLKNNNNIGSGGKHIGISMMRHINNIGQKEFKDISWADLEKQFHTYFFAGIDEIKLSDLISVRQQEGESAMEYIQRFRNVRSRCYSLSLSDVQLADLAFQGLSTPI